MTQIQSGGAAEFGACIPGLRSLAHANLLKRKLGLVGASREPVEDHGSDQHDRNANYARTVQRLPEHHEVMRAIGIAPAHAQFV